MGIRGEDQRRVIRPNKDSAEFNSFPLTAVTAIDTIFPGQPPFSFGSGNAILSFNGNQIAVLNNISPDSLNQDHFQQL